MTMKALSIGLLTALVASTFATAQGPKLLVRDPRGGEAPLHIEDVAINITVAGDVAETTITVGFRNATKRMLEGDFVMPLPPGATVSSYALEVNGAMREGVAVEKERARHAYESIKRQMIDPGLVEREAGNVYRTRIFPIQPESVKRVRLGYVEHLTETDGKHLYKLPLAFPTPVAEFSCRIEGEGMVGLNLVERPGIQFTQDPSGRLATRVTNKKIDGNLVVHVVPPKLPSALVESHNVAGESFFHLTDRVPEDLAIPSRSAPKRILLVWDASESRQDHDRELALLDAWFRQIGSAKVRLQLLRNTAREHGEFTVRKGNWNKLKSALQNVYHDGATRLDLLPLDQVEEDIVLLCTDGVLPLGVPAAPANRPVFVLNGAARSIDASLEAYARHSGGAAIELAQLEGDAAVGKLTNRTLRIVSVEGDGIHSCHFDPDLTPGEAVRISGGFNRKAPDTIRVNYGYEQTVLRTTTVRVGGAGLAHSRFPRRLWAQAVLADLEATHPADETRIVAHCKRHGLVSDRTSLIVLERFEDHLRYKIPPPEADLRKRYEEALAKKKKTTDPKNKWDGLIREWKWKQEWHRKEFPWMDIALLPRLEQVTIWTRAIGKLFQKDELDAAAFGVIDTWRKEALTVIERRTQLRNGEDLEEWTRKIGELVERGSKLRATPVQSPKAGQKLMVSVRGLVNTPGTIAGKPDLTLREAIIKAGGIHPLGSETYVELYRNAGKTVYNMASKKFVDVPLKPGDMIVVEEEERPYDDWDVDPFSANPEQPYDPSEEPAVVEDSDLWVSNRGSADDDPFAGSEAAGGSAPGFRSAPMSLHPTDLPVKLGGTIRIGTHTTILSPTMEKFATALAEGDDAESAYRQLRKPGRYPASFYVEAARILTARKHPQLAEQVLSNLLELPELDLEHLLAASMWLGEFGRWESARILLDHAREHFPGEVLLDYHRAMVAIQLGKKPSTLPEVPQAIADGKRSHLQVGTIALTDLNGLAATRFPNLSDRIPSTLRGNLDTDLRVVVMSSNPAVGLNLYVHEPSGHTCQWASPCGGRSEQSFGLGQYMMRRALPGRYKINCRAQRPMTVRAILYQNWGRKNQTSKAVTLLLDGKGTSTTLAEYEFVFEE